MGKFEKVPQKRGSGRVLITILSVIFVLLMAVTGGAVYILMNYHIVGTKLYAKDLQVLDLREEDLTVRNYKKLQEKMPGTRIRWEIPFQGDHLADDAEEITITNLSAGDIEILEYARQLKLVQAEGCTDYENLQLLRQHRPELKITYSIALSAGSFSWDIDTLVLDRVEESDISLLQYLPNLKKVVLEPGRYEQKTVEALRGVAHNSGLDFGVIIGGGLYMDTEKTLDIKGITEEELGMIAYLTCLEQLHLENPVAEPDTLFAMQETYPGMDITWQVSFDDQVFDQTVTEIDLSMVAITDLKEVEQKLAYLPELETVTFGLCGVDDSAWGNSRSKLTASAIPNEDLAAYRDRVREDYKVVWTVRLGPSIALRTDADNFMPNHFGVGQLPDNYAYNLRYCEDMVCLDVGHMTLTDISFVEFMPKLKYLILAWTEVQYIEPIRSCKNLVFLELDNSCIRDVSPLVDCTALEDLNLGNTFCDVTPILEMSWLKNVYFIDSSPASAYKVSQAIPTARVVATGNATVGGGWRRLPNYYAMRDCLNMPYMN